MLTTDPGRHHTQEGETIRTAAQAPPYRRKPCKGIDLSLPDFCDDGAFDPFKKLNDHNNREKGFIPFIRGFLREASGKTGYFSLDVSKDLSSKEEKCDSGKDISNGNRTPSSKKLCCFY